MLFHAGGRLRDDISLWLDYFFCILCKHLTIVACKRSTQTEFVFAKTTRNRSSCDLNFVTPDAVSFTHMTPTCIAGGHSIEPLTLVRHTITMDARERQHGTNQQDGDHRDSCLVLCFSCQKLSSSSLQLSKQDQGTYNLAAVLCWLAVPVQHGKALLQGTALSASFTIDEHAWK